jgi:hypothetical protein
MGHGGNIIGTILDTWRENFPPGAHVTPEQIAALMDEDVGRVRASMYNRSRVQGSNVVLVSPGVFMLDEPAPTNPAVEKQKQTNRLIRVKRLANDLMYELDDLFKDYSELREKARSYDQVRKAMKMAGEE